MKIYIGGAFSARKRIANEAKYLIEAGHIVLSRWFNLDDPLELLPDGGVASILAEAKATRDVYDILEADIVIIDSLDKSTTGGYHVELGLALMRSLIGRPLRVIHIGPYNNIFQNLAREYYASWEELLEDSGL